jgi:hypothetical protein
LSALPATIAVPESVLFRVVGDEAVLLNLDTECYYGLDPVGTRFWQVLTGSSSVASGYRQLLDEYAVEPAQLLSDVRAWLDRLTTEGLLDVGKS